MALTGKASHLVAPAPLESLGNELNLVVMSVEPSELFLANVGIVLEG